MQKRKKEFFNVTVYNENGKPRWELVIKEIKPNKEYHVEETMKYSLFNNPLSVGKTPGKAIDKFLEIEEELLKSLG